MDQDGWLRGLECARNLNFTDAQYEEALKRIDTPDNANQLLLALLDIDKNSVAEAKTELSTTDSSGQQPTLTTSAVDRPDAESSSSSSCYSSITSFPSSTDQSLDNLQQSIASLRDIYIDGPNVARTHGKNGSFSWTGIKLCVDWFSSRQHRVKVFVPTERCHNQADVAIISKLIHLDVLIETPTGCNDDLFVIEAARINNGVIVSNDLYRDEKRFNEELKHFIRLNRLPYVFVDDLFIPANDPRGRSGPTLDEFLREGEHNNTNHHTKLSGTKSYQRYQRNGPSTRQFNNNGIYHRSLISTRSLPIDRTRAPNHAHNHPIQLRGINQGHPQERLDTNHQQRPGMQDIRRTVSVAYPKSHDATSAPPAKESETSSVLSTHRRALYRTKSHI